jgi:DNA-directed RNA polymerase beta' subunit
MAFKLLDTNKFLHKVKARTVTNTFTFDRNMEPTEAGLQSPSIFGSSANERFTSWGSIELHDTVMHPLIFENLSSIDPAFKRAKDKTREFEIVGGMLKEVPNGNNGVGWLIANWDKINFDKYRTDKNKLFIDLVKQPDSPLFVSRIPVIPINYREAHQGSFKMEEDEVDALYKSILSVTKPGRSEFTSSMMEKIKDKAGKDFIQDNVNKLYKHFISKLDSKRGFLRNTLTAKRLDNVARLVANARPDVPVDSCVLPWQILLNLFDAFVVAYINIDEEKGGDLKEKLGVTNKSIDEMGELFDFIYRNVDIYDKEYPGKKELWIQILVDVFNENPLLRVMAKRDPGWNADSMWVFKCLINSDNRYNIWVPSWVYSPLGGDSYTTSFFIDELKDDVIFEDDDYIITGDREKARVVKTLDGVWKRLEKYSRFQPDFEKEFHD